MPTLKVYSPKKRKVAELEVSEVVFGAEPKPHLLHEVVVWQLAKRRAGTHSTRTRVEVRGGGRKPWRQKGTGRARAGTRSSPLWRGGGVVFGPKPRDYSYRLPKKIRRQALRVALSDKLRNDELLVLRGVGLKEIKTKEFAALLDLFGLASALFVTDAPDEVLEKSSRNVPNIKVLRAEGLNVYDILRHQRLVLLEPAVKAVEEALS